MYEMGARMRVSGVCVAVGWGLEEVLRFSDLHCALFEKVMSVTSFI